MEKTTPTRLLSAMFSVALMLMSACGSSAQVTAATASNESAATQQSSTESAPAGEVRPDGAPLVNRMGVCDAYDPALIGQWVGIEDIGYTSSGGRSDGCLWGGDAWDTTHRAGHVSMVIFSQQAYEAKTTKFEPFVGGPDGSFIYNDVHVYLEHDGYYVRFVVLPTQESYDESILPADNVALYTEVINAMLPQLSEIEKA